MSATGRTPRLIVPPGTRRLSRRLLLRNMGAAGFGLTILGACAGSSDDGAPATGAAGPDPTTAPPTDPPAATTTGAPTTEPAATEAPAEPAAGAGDEALMLQHVSLGFVSAYVLLRGNEAAVVDTGTPGSAGAILDGLGMLGASWSDVDHVVLTHKHGDHVGGLEEVLVEAPGATVYAGEADIGEIASSVPLRAIGDGDEILGMGVLNTPGHTPGSISLFDTDTGILVAGDAINGEDGRLTGANASFSSDMVAAGASIALLAALEPEVAAFGHGGPPISTDVAAQLAALAPS